MAHSRTSEEKPQSEHLISGGEGAGTGEKRRSGKSVRTPKSMLAWTASALTLGFLILTAVYASHDTAASRLRFLYTSSSNTIFVLSVLSSFTGLFLGATITATFETVQWLLISRQEGLQLSNFLSLEAGTGLMGLLRLMAGRGLRMRSTTRMWAAVRLLSIILIPILSILIMSNVNTRMIFDIVHDTPASLGWGMSLFNASLAKNVSSIADQVVQADLAMFLSAPHRSVDITPQSQRTIPCSHVPGRANTQNCRRVYYIPGGAELAVVQETRNGSRSQADVDLAQSQQGYIFDFVEGPGANEEWEFKGNEDCEMFGFPFGAFHLCLKNGAKNTLHARIVHCPTSTSVLSDCYTNTSWHASPGWTTSLTTTFRRGTVAYSRANGTILSHEFTSSPTPAPVSASEMLDGYRSAFSSFPDLSSLLSLLADPDATNMFPLYVYPAMVWANLKSIESLSPRNPAIVTRAQDTIQCLLAIMLYYCQPSLFARTLSIYTNSSELGNATNGNSFAQLKSFANDLLSLAPPDTQVRQAVTRYRLVVGRGTLAAYVVLCGVALLLCLIVLGWAKWTERSGNMDVPRIGPFPAWDERVKCIVEGKEGRVLEEAKNGEGKMGGGMRLVEGSEVIRLAERMRVVLVKEEVG
ncbi:hypothetical protein K469DRAFT_684256 [Zopfia rhizophila CBS 207.26]|uniref:Uncharacterized protein n=1 Tax=Zopfia rhizophila CBS 207.26 TaxID=1314779 RepID=A0A6A6EDW7_9PEZI|nr:hypothetical protein K469DRAFT_684256 [Zopfia rhizophila CBS 207.26]